LADAVQIPANTRGTDTPEALAQLICQLHLAVAGQRFCHRDQIGLQQLGTDVVVGLRDDPKCVVHLGTIVTLPLILSRFALARPIQPTKKRFAMNAQYRNPTVQQLCLLSARGLPILSLAPLIHDVSRSPAEKWRIGEAWAILLLSLPGGERL
jgi:hypothetical protein